MGRQARLQFDEEETDSSGLFPLMTNLILQTFTLACSSTQSLFSGPGSEKCLGKQVPQILYFHDLNNNSYLMRLCVLISNLHFIYVAFFKLIINLVSPIS